LSFTQGIFTAQPGKGDKKITAERIDERRRINLNRGGNATGSERED
jgi:hypothetical protein